MGHQARMQDPRSPGLRSALAAVLAAALLVTGACAGDDDDGSTDVPVATTAAGSAAGEAQIVTDLDITASATDGVVLREVVLPAPGYVGVYEDGDGAPGRRLGSSEQLPAGRTAEVRVTYDTSTVQPEAVWVILHTEDNATTTLDWPDADAPVEIDGSIVTLRIPVED